MRKLINTTYRTNDAEIMDDFSIEGPILHDTLNTLANINKWLGGNAVTLNALKSLLANYPKNRPLTIIDLGCGGGDILRRIAKYGQKEGYTFQLIGVDANKEAVVYAQQLSEAYPNISYVACNILSEQFDALEYDIVLATLFLHHFENEQITKLLTKLTQKAKLGIIINDLHRHAWAYYLFKIVCIPIKNQMIIDDGLTSILRGFKRKELIAFSKQLNATPKISWKWAFRYQWIIQKK
ncbi:methyltransferase domain-containing protein [Bizionia sediminis]|uniref:Methyltransferase domain-containing protein n=1 Tax=Bizionia sediminis TaxID=1737064 RepID=A0ABW5KVC4_9FLAO